jgi:hypothetical protein
MPKEEADSVTRTVKPVEARRDPRPPGAASAGRQVENGDPTPRRGDTRGKKTRPRASLPVKERLFAHPGMAGSRGNGGLEQLLDRKAKRPGAKSKRAGFTSFENLSSRPSGQGSRDVKLRRLKEGSHVIGGTILGRIGKTIPSKPPHLHFEIRPAGRGAPRTDPRPILDGWKLLERTAIYCARPQRALRPRRRRPVDRPGCCCQSRSWRARPPRRAN